MNTTKILLFSLLLPTIALSSAQGSVVCLPGGGCISDGNTYAYCPECPAGTGSSGPATGSSSTIASSAATGPVDTKFLKQNFPVQIPSGFGGGVETGAGIGTGAVPTGIVQADTGFRYVILTAEDEARMREEAFSRILSSIPQVKETPGQDKALPVKKQASEDPNTAMGWLKAQNDGQGFGPGVPGIALILALPPGLVKQYMNQGMSLEKAMDKVMADFRADAEKIRAEDKNLTDEEVSARAYENMVKAGEEAEAKDSK